MAPAKPVNGSKETASNDDDDDASGPAGSSKSSAAGAKPGSASKESDNDDDGSAPVAAGATIDAQKGDLAIKLLKGANYPVTLPGDAKAGTVKAPSSEAGIATFDPKPGQINALATGVTTITLTAPDGSVSTIQVTVVDESASVSSSDKDSTTGGAHAPPPPIVFDLALSAQNMTLEAARAGGNGAGQPVLFPPVVDWNIYRHIKVVAGSGLLRFSSERTNPCPQGAQISFLGAGGVAITGTMGLDINATGDFPAGTVNASVGFADTFTQYNDNGYERCTITFEVTGD